MCNAATCNHDPLDDDFEDIFGAPTEKRALTDEAAASIFNAGHGGKKFKSAEAFIEACPKCGGSGRFVGYTGRVLGRCFHCGGTGKVEYKTSPETRADNAQKRAELAIRKARELEQKAIAWRAEFAAEATWLKDASFDFAVSMKEAIAKYGFLTPNQLAAVRRCMARDEQKAQERREIEERAPDIDATALTKIMDAFNAALAKQVKKPKMRLDCFYFTLVTTGNNAGAIYVKHLEEEDATYGGRRFMGKIVNGRFIKGFRCTDEEQDRIVAAACDPEAAAVAYGRRVGACSICGLALTNHASIDRGIGPICASKYGWAGIFNNDKEEE